MSTSLSTRFLLDPSVAFWGGLLVHLSQPQKERLPGIGDTQENPCGYYFHLAAVLIVLIEKVKNKHSPNVWRLKCALTTFIRPETLSYVH